MHQAGTDPGAGIGEVGRADRVDRMRADRVGLGVVDVGQSRTVDHQVSGPDVSQGGRGVGDVTIPAGQRMYLVAA